MWSIKATNVYCKLKFQKVVMATAPPPPKKNNLNVNLSLYLAPGNH
jgi:hypothetical protein